jgi:hypothetical protein
MPTPPRLLQTDPVKLVELLSHLSQLGVRPHAGWLQDVLDVLAPSLPALSAAHLASMLQVLGSWGFTPRAPFLQQLHGAVRRRLADRELSLRNMADMTWALAQLNSPCKPLLDDLLAGAHTALGAAGAGNRSVPAAALQPASSSSSSSSSHKGAAASSSSGGGSAQPRTHPQQQVQDAHGGVCPGALADLLWSVAKLQCDVSPRWLALFAARSRALLPAFTPHQLAQLVWALARLPFHPGQPYLDDLLAAVSASLPAFEAKAISLTAWGLATLKATPGRRWLFAFERQAERTLSSLACAELACTLWALGELKAKRPHELRLGRLVRRQEGAAAGRGCRGGSERCVCVRARCCCWASFGGGGGCCAATLPASCLPCLCAPATTHARSHTHPACPGLPAAGFQNFDFEALANPRLLRVVRQLTLGPPHRRGAEGTGSA